MAALREPFYTPEEYLELERKGEHKSEYLAGQIFAMAGWTQRHARITCNISGELRSLLKGQPCESFSTDLRVQVQATGLYAYPDVVVVCGEAILADSHADTLLNPTVIFEVLSPSTESYDRGLKFVHYRRLESLTDYVLVLQEQRLVEHFIRQPSGDWLLHTVDGLDDGIVLASLNCRLPLSEIYERVLFENDTPA